VDDCQEENDRFGYIQSLYMTGYRLLGVMYARNGYLYPFPVSQEYLR